MNCAKPGSLLVNKMFEFERYNITSSVALTVNPCINMYSSLCTIKCIYSFCLLKCVFKKRKSLSITSVCEMTTNNNFFVLKKQPIY